MCFWDVGGYSLRFIYRLSTSALFDGEFGAPSGERTDEEDWPPFKKVRVGHQSPTIWIGLTISSNSQIWRLMITRSLISD